MPGLRVLALDETVMHANTFAPVPTRYDVHMDNYMSQDQQQQQAGKARHGHCSSSGRPYLTFAPSDTTFPSQEHIKFLRWIQAYMLSNFLPSGLMMFTWPT